MFLLGLFAAVGNGFGMHQLLAGFLFALGFFVLPFVALLLGIAAFSEPYHLPRATLWAGATGTLAGGSLMVYFTLTLTAQENAISATAFWLVCCFPLLVAALVVGMVFIAQAAAELRQEVEKAREGRALNLIEARGTLRVAELAAELKLAEAEAAALAQMLVDTRQLFGGLLDAPQGHVYSPSAVQAKQRQLANLVKARGEVRLDDLSAELPASPEVVRAWLSALARDYKLAGYLEEDPGQFHALPVEHLRAATACPHCGGPVRLAAEGATLCPACGVVIFAGPEA